MFKKTILLMISVCAFGTWAEDKKTARYYVTVTNMSQTQTFSPPLIAIHSPDYEVFSPGKRASAGVARIAEDGDRSLLIERLNESGKVDSLYEAKNMIKPGQSYRYLLTADKDYSVLSVVTMLVTTNDGFTGVSAMPLPWGTSRSLVPAWDAGSEANTEDCAHIPGPPCGSMNVRITEGAEGKIQLHPGITGQGELSASRFSWSNPVAKITVQKL